MKNLYYVLDENGYIKSYANGQISVDGVGSIEFPTPDNFNEAWFSCYKRIEDTWIFDESKKAHIIEEETNAMSTPTLEERLAVAEAAILALMDLEVI